MHENYARNKPPVSSSENPVGANGGKLIALQLLVSVLIRDVH